MSNEVSDDTDEFFQMASDFPVRTCIFTLGLPAFALLQLINGVVHETSVLYVGLFAALTVAFSVVLTRYHVAAYRRQKLQP